jgi:hypothetical protein
MASTQSASQASSDVGAFAKKRDACLRLSKSTKALASVITQVSANAVPQARRAPPPRKKPQSKAVKRTTHKPTETSPAAPSSEQASDVVPMPESIPLPSTSNTTPESSTDEHKVTEKERLDTPQSSTLKAASSLPPSPYKGKSTQKPKLSPWQSFLAALGCSSRKHFEDEDNNTTSPMQEKPKPEKLKRKLSNRRSKDVPAVAQVPDASQTTSSQTSLLASKNTAEAGPSTLTPAAERPDIHSQEMQANSSRAGVTLPREETEDVLSGAVVPPGADGHTPTGTPRKKRSKASTRGGLGDVTATTLGDSESGGSAEEGSEHEHSEDEEEDDFIDDQDEEDRIIAAGGMGIPIGPVGAFPACQGQRAELRAGRQTATAPDRDRSSGQRAQMPRAGFGRDARSF